MVLVKCNVHHMPCLHTRCLIEQKVLYEKGIEKEAEDVFQCLATV